MKLKKGDKEAQYLAESSSKPGNFYIVDINRGSCSCPQWMFRLIKTGGKCKHILAVEKKYKLKVKERKPAAEKTEKEPTKVAQTKKNKIIEYVKEKQQVDSIELIEKFSEKEVNALLEQGELIEEKGIIKLL